MVSWFLGFEVSSFLGFKIGFKVSWSLGLKNLGFLVPKFQRFKNTQIEIASSIFMIIIEV